MNKTTRLLTFLGIFCAVVSLQAQSLADFHTDIFLGNWKMQTPKGVLTEEWTKAGPEIMIGKSYRIQNGDTTVLEIVQLKVLNNKLVYAPVVSGQNEGNEVLFTYSMALSDSAARRFVFENLEHDYPQRIIYYWKDAESLLARVEGIVDGKLKFSEYDYKKVVR